MTWQKLRSHFCRSLSHVMNISQLNYQPLQKNQLNLNFLHKESWLGRSVYQMYRWRNWSTGTYAFRYSEHTLGHGALQTRDICLNYILHLSPNTLMKLIIKINLRIITLHTLAALQLSQSIAWIVYRAYIYINEKTMTFNRSRVRFHQQALYKQSIWENDDIQQIKSSIPPTSVIHTVNKRKRWCLKIKSTIQPPSVINTIHEMNIETSRNLIECRQPLIHIW